MVDQSTKACVNFLPRYSGGGLGRGPFAHGAGSTQPPPQPSPGVPGEGESRTRAQVNRRAQRLFRRWKFAAVVGFLTTVGFGANVGDVMYVNRVSLPIRNGKFAFNKVVAMAV